MTHACPCGCQLPLGLNAALRGGLGRSPENGSVREHIRIGTEVVDGLRGFAILWVLCYHTWLFSWYTPGFKLFGYDVPVDVLARTGYLGVELFFVISGFCLFVPVARSMVEGAPPQGLRRFALRRALKIVPSYVIALCVTVPFAFEYLQTRGEAFRSLVPHLAFVQNFTSDPLGQANSVFWTLAVEVQFYLVFPALVWLFRRGSPLAATVLACGLAATYRTQTAACCLLVESVTRQLPAYLDVFACGMLAAYGVIWTHARAPHIRRLAIPMTFATIGLALVTFHLLQTDNAVQYVPGGRERWDTLGRTELAVLLGAFVFCASFALGPLRRAIANPIFVALSLISYNLYLWHTLVMIWLWKHDVPRAATPDPHRDDHWKPLYIALGWSLSFAIATAMTYFVERPILGIAKPHGFAFDWRRVRRSNAWRAAPGATETRT